MMFREALKEALWLLLTEKRISYQRLKLELDLDDAHLEGLRHELIQVKRVAVDQCGEFLVWAGTAEMAIATSPCGAPSPTEPLTTVREAKATVQPKHRAPVETPLEIAVSPTAEPAPPAALSSDAERRPLTVMFCDLADSTALSTRLDPEDLQDVIRAYRERCAGVIREFEGFIAKYMGDGILVYFGYPQSLERNAERAVRTGLAIIDAMARLNAELGRAKGIDIAVRIGIATGLVVVGEIVGEGLAQERTVIGEAPNVAARLQSIAPRNGIVVGALTKEIIGDGFVYQDLGARELKGVTGLVKAWQVTGLRDDSAEEASQAQTSSKAVPPQLVGRDEETGLLRRAWQSTKDEKRGQVVTISGEAGIGKSVLVDALSAEVRAEGLAQITFRCSLYHANSALYPVIEHIKRLVRWQPEDEPKAKLAKLEAMLEGYSLPPAEAVPLFAALLAMPLPEGRHRQLDLTPQQLRQQTQDALIAWTLEEAEQQPLLEVWEDLHWADPSTLELLGLLIEQAPTAALLIVLTARPDFVPPWPARSHITPISLNRLERLHTEALVARIAGMKPLPAEVVDHIVAKTDGVPLYVEELTKTILASDILRDRGERYELAGPLSSLSIPATLQESLMARLDRLPQVREIAQLGAVLGREFAYEMISGLSVINESTLREGLGQLVAAELLYQRGRPPRAKYIFKHALIQDAAYQSLLKRARQYYHQQVAQLLEAQFPDTVEAHPELVAHHFGEAGCTEEAVVYSQKAGHLALRRSANVEAVTHFERALELLRQLPETIKRKERELEVQMALGPALVATRGFADAGVGRAWERAWELCHQLEDSVRLPLVLRGRQVFYLLSGELNQAREFAKQFLDLAERQQDPALQVGSYHAMGQTQFFHGDLVGARRTVEQGIALFDPQQHRLPNWSGGQPGEQCYLYGAFLMWMLGYPDQALRLSEQALSMANELPNPANLINTLAFVATVHVLCRDLAAARQRSEATIKFSAEQRNPTFLGHATILHGWAQAALSQDEDGLAEIQQGTAIFRATGARTWVPYFLGLQAEAYAWAKRLTDGLASVDEALALAEGTEQGCWQAELNRIRGELLLAVSSSNQADALSCFSQALDIARRQQAKCWELRAVMSLAKLWQRQGKRKEARELLAPVYGWFTEGFETADLKDAKALLHELV